MSQVDTPVYFYPLNKSVFPSHPPPLEQQPELELLLVPKALEIRLTFVIALV